MERAASSVSHDNQLANKKKQHEDKSTGRYFPALVLVAAILPLPFLAALITIIAYLTPYPLPKGDFFTSLGPGNMVVILGLIITLVLWFLLAIPCMRFATAQGGRPSDYESLRRELTVLKKEVDVIECDSKVAIADIRGNLDDIDEILKRDGLTWLSTGYVSLWDRVNKADEAITDVLPCRTVIESAKYEELRLKNSQVPDSENLLKLLEKAITTLSSDPKCFKQSSEQNQGTNLQQSMAQAILALLKKAIDNGKVSQQSVQEARADIRKVKAALHKFTNERWDGLVRARNVLVVTAFLAALFTYILVAIAILAEVLEVKIEEAMVFYFLGAIVGLFSRIYDETNTDSVIDDYGLTMARIIVTPLLSGLAALVGVFLVTILSITITSQYNATSTIGDIYDFVKYPQNLVFAAIFGYVPNLVMSILQRKSEEIKGQIKSTSPAGQSPADQSNGDSKAGKGSSSDGSSSLANR